MSAKAEPDPASVHAAKAAGRAPPGWLRVAGLPDAEAIVSLVNTAYRPGAGQRGWTHEAELLDGPRINHAQVSELVLRPDSVILVGQRDTRLAACVHVQKKGMSSHIGMLAVYPEFQGLGMGSGMLRHAEWHARCRFQSNAVVMTVITRRTELMSFYLNRGYRLSGETEAYPWSAGVGAPKYTDLNLSKLVKSLE